MSRAFEKFIGQKDAVRRLKRQLNGSRRRGRVMGHIKIEGPGGIGKSKLACAIAALASKDLDWITGNVIGVDGAELLI